MMWRLGRRKILPSAWVNRKEIIECDSVLVDISRERLFSMDERVKRRGGCWVREEVRDFLRAAALFLPEGYRLHFFGGWRHFAVQWAHWEEQLVEKRKQFPNVSEEELRRIARMTSADPSRGGFGPHQTGGAVDLTVVDKNGKELDMGTPFSFHEPRAQTDFPGITKTQRKNRDILRHAMELAGFQNYPGEWWHWSYGDRAYAAYRRLPYAIYGPVYCADYKLKPEEKKIFQHGANPSLRGKSRKNKR
jgi:D-alanyl-D-alanine dipeptidase